LTGQSLRVFIAAIAAFIMSANSSNPMIANESERRELLVVQAGRRLIGIFTDNVAGIARGKSPSPLPRAPASVLGVVAFRGRMLTVLDLLVLLGDPANELPPALIVALSGEEQLAIVADASHGAIQISSQDIEDLPHDGDAGLVSGTLRRYGDQIQIIDVAHLFGATMQQRERRRRRF